MEMTGEVLQENECRGGKWNLKRYRVQFGGRNRKLDQEERGRRTSGTQQMSLRDGRDGVRIRERKLNREKGRRDHVGGKNKERKKE